jgi:hypothetical protein
MPAPTVQEFHDGKRDLDDLEALINSSAASVATRLGGSKETYTAITAKIVHGEITAYSALTTYTAIDEWVEESGIVYRPLPSELPIGPEAFDADKWIAVQGLNPASKILSPVADYVALRAINPSVYADGSICKVTDEGIAGDFVLVKDTAHGLSDNGGTIIVIDADNYFRRVYSGAVNVRWFGAAGDGVTDDYASIQAALAFKNVVIPSGTYLCNTALTPLSTQTITGQGVNVTRIKAGTDGMTVINYPSSSYNNIKLRDFTIDGDNKADYGLSLIGQSQGLVSNCSFENISAGNCAITCFYMLNLTYCVFNRCVASGGQVSVDIRNSYSTDLFDCIFYNGATCAYRVYFGSQVVARKCNFFNDVLNPSPSISVLDGGIANGFVDCEFEAQGASNVTAELVIRRSVAGANCTDNFATRCRFIGLANTKTRCLVVADAGAVYKTRIEECGFIKPTSTESISLGALNTETMLCRNYDLVTYDTPTYSKVTYVNTGNPVVEEEFLGTFSNVTTRRGIAFPAVENPSGNVNNLTHYINTTTFSPTLATTGTSYTSVTYNAARAGKYTKIGSIVFFDVFMQTDAVTVGAATGNMVIGGLPFAASTSAACCVSNTSGFAVGQPIAAQVSAGTSNIALLFRTAVDGVTSFVPVTHTGTGASGNLIRVSGHYFVN